MLVGECLHVRSSIDGLTCDTEGFFTFDQPLRSDERVQVTHSVDTNVIFFRAQACNLDHNEAVRDVKVTVTVGAGRSLPERQSATNYRDNCIDG